jgi:putative two-component system response regulator
MEKETLLIVEDNHEVRVGLEDLLSLEGFRVVTAANGIEALEKLTVISPDLILSDISMPFMDGFDLFRAVRSRPDLITIPFIFLTARARREDIVIGRGLGVEDYLVKPISRDELIAAVKGRLARSKELRVAQLQQAYQNTVTMLANAIEVRNEYTRGHVERVTAYALAMGERLGLSVTRLEELRYGAILHDIGKILVREQTLMKQKTLTRDEWLEIRQHPVTGAEMIKNIPYLAPIVPIIRHHHERWDGHGYPDGLQGEEIPLEARIIAAADSLDAMTTNRAYQKALTLQKAHDIIIQGGGSQYDPVVVECFISIWESGAVHEIATKYNPSKQYLTTT